MRFRTFSILATALLCLAATASMADLGPYSQDFEGLDQTSPTALGDDGWLIFANVFNPGGGYLYGYGVFPAPNGGPGFSGIDINQGGPEQGDQQLVIYNDYNNGDHAFGNFIEANVFQEQIVGAADVGSTWLFEYDAKAGNIVDDVAGTTVAAAFIKTLDPNNGFQTTNNITNDTTDLPGTWARYVISIDIDASLVGQILQIGFVTTTTSYAPSGNFYDNINFSSLPTGACCALFDECSEVAVGECLGEYQGDGTTCDEAECEGPLHITLCHIPPGNNSNAHTITVGLAAAQAHLDHGDSIGACEIRPDIEFTLGSEGRDGSSPIDFQEDSIFEDRSELPQVQLRKLQRKPKLSGARSN